VAQSESPKTDGPKEASDNKSSMSISASTDKPVDPASEPPKSQENKDNPVVETETIRGKNGAVITRTTMKDGTVNIKRVSSSGKVAVDMNNFYDMAGAT